MPSDEKALGMSRNAEFTLSLTLTPPSGDSKLEFDGSPRLDTQFKHQVGPLVGVSGPLHGRSSERSGPRTLPAPRDIAGLLRHWPCVRLHVVTSLVRYVTCRWHGTIVRTVLVVSTTEVSPSSLQTVLRHFDPVQNPLGSSHGLVHTRRWSAPRSAPSSWRRLVACPSMTRARPWIS
jgi:hypothetical protein